MFKNAAASLALENNRASFETTLQFPKTDGHHIVSVPTKRCLKTQSNMAYSMSVVSLGSHEALVRACWVCYLLQAEIVLEGFFL